ncbi:MAG: response regulator [Actinomycetota bacterium]|nr:response regulator [Actinomycetota bacterium]
MTERGGRIRVLLVDDSPAEVSLTTEVLAEAGMAGDVAVVGDGEAALAYLRGEGAFCGAPRPDVVLLDLNLPRRSGQEVLAEMQEDEALRAIPVVVLTRSAGDADVRAGCGQQAAAFLAKPVVLEDLLGTVAAIEGLWPRAVRYPDR